MWRGPHIRFPLLKLLVSSSINRCRIGLSMSFGMLMSSTDSNSRILGSKKTHHLITSNCLRINSRIKCTKSQTFSNDCAYWILQSQELLTIVTNLIIGDNTHRAYENSHFFWNITVYNKDTCKPRCLCDCGTTKYDKSFPQDIVNAWEIAFMWTLWSTNVKMKGFVCTRKQNFKRTTKLVVL